jgi:DNA-binding LytR/AlgR family response regulator
VVVMAEFVPPVVVLAQEPAFKILAVDDEAPSLTDLVFELRAFDCVAQVVEARDATDALRALRMEEFDAVFLDVRMPGLDGLELARILQQFKVAPVVVFVTAFDAHAVDAFEINAVDYLLKPVRRERLEQALEKIRVVLAQRVVARVADQRAEGAATDGVSSQFRVDEVAVGARAVSAHASVAIPSESDAKERKLETEMISIESGGRIRLIDRRDIQYAMSSGDYVRLYLKDSSVLMRTAMASLEERWASAGFVRIHRSYLVSLAHVDQVRVEPGGTYVVYVGERALPVSRRLAGSLRSKLLEYAESRVR